MWPKPGNHDFKTLKFALGDLSIAAIVVTNAIEVHFGSMDICM